MSDHDYLFIQKLVYTLLLVILPVFAESNSSLNEDISKHMSTPSDAKKPLDSIIPQKNKITLEGTYEFRADQTSLEIRGKQICFFPNIDSSKKTPRPAGDLRLSWFCFSNLNHAASLLGVSFEVSDNDCGVEGEAKIIVSDYEIYKEEGDGNDFAKLIEVLEKSNTHPLPCEKKSMLNRIKKRTV